KPTLQLTLFHNGKQVRYFKAGQTEKLLDNPARLAAICGNPFAQQAIPLNYQHQSLTLTGFILPQVSQTEVFHYFYINGRMIKDRLLNHAIRQAYQTYFNQELQPSYILYLQLDPYQVDMNVHPTKQEVRFHQSRLVHDFVYQAVLTTLHNTAIPVTHSQSDITPAPKQETHATTSSVTDQNRRAAGRNHFINNHAVEASKSFNRPSSNQLREQQALYQQVLATTTTTTTATVTPPDATQSTTTRPLIPEQHVMKTQMDELFLQASAHTFG